MEDLDKKMSETGAKVPAMCIFTYTLFFGSVAGAVAVCYRNLIMRYLLVNEDQRLMKLNDIGAIIGLISMAGLAGVGAFPVSTVFWAHMLAAGVHFVFAMVYIILQTFINHYVPGANVLVKRLRILFCVAVLLLLFLLVIFFPLSFVKWNKVNSGPPALKTPDDEIFGLMFSSAFFEWVMYGAFLSFISTLSIEFRKFHLTIGVVPVTPKSDEDT
ncbi:DNA damage-regulated autophagy modulator like protein [Argiope bruennichi]|uniref:DNA damage-regulated autophagy modulator like protein n=1 Tax=Argiope bruennichi TaxID=94029 RepID=A0A8T0FGE7_ARGBR|nr:DNA damage-regulated autophagy modulator like protein [Argiope bruennichi]